MRYLKDKQVYQIEIQKSIFICVLYPLESINDKDMFLEEARLAYPKANHYCNASIYGEFGEQQTASDDGEPQRTAGIPMLEVLKHHDITNVLAVVIRYFGGIKLGAGGLLRAYTKAVADTLKTSKFYQKKIVSSFEVSFPYHLVNKLDQIDQKKVTILKKTFLEHVTYHLVLLDDDLSIFDEMKHEFISMKEMPPQILYIDEP